MFDASPDVLRDPYPLYARLRSASPLLHHPTLDLYAVFDYAGVERVMTDHASFGSAVAGGQPGTWLIFSDPPRHARLRAIISRVFTPRSVAELEPRIRSVSARLLDAQAGASVMDLVGDYAVPLPLVVIAELLGVPAGDYPRFRRWSEIMLGLIHTLEGGAAAERATEAFLEASREMGGYLADLGRAGRAGRSDDLLGRLRSAEVDGQRLGEAEILGFFQLLLFAGHETTTNLIANAVTCLLEHPSALAWARADPDRIPALLEEVLRHRSPVQVAFRVTKRDVTLHGRTIGANQRVLAMIGSANRDPARFTDPDRFDPTRAARPHLGFGHGIHFCLGAALARLEASVALRDLLFRLPSLSRASEEPWEPRPSFHVHGPSRLLIRVSLPSAA